MILQNVESHSDAIVILKILITIISVAIASINFYAYFEFLEISGIFRDFKNAEVTGYIASLAVMSSVLSSYGAVLYYFEDQPKYRSSANIAIFGFLVWDVGLFLELLISTVILFYCYVTVDYIFEGGFEESMSKYGTDSKVASAIDTLQMRFSCCGNEDHTEWFKVQWNETETMNHIGFPESCCNVVAAEKLNIPCVSSVVYNEAYKLVPYNNGCLRSLKWWYGVIFLLSSCLAFLTTSLHLIGLAMMMKMMMTERKSYTSEERKKLIFHQNALFQAAKEVGLKYL